MQLPTTYSGGVEPLKLIFKVSLGIDFFLSLNEHQGFPEIKKTLKLFAHLTKGLRKHEIFFFVIQQELRVWESKQNQKF